MSPNSRDPDPDDKGLAVLGQEEPAAGEPTQRQPDVAGVEGAGSGRGVGNNRHEDVDGVQARGVAGQVAPEGGRVPNAGPSVALGSSIRARCRRAGLAWTPSTSVDTGWTKAV